jgi:hypothetical protein
MRIGSELTAITARLTRALFGAGVLAGVALTAACSTSSSPASSGGQCNADPSRCAIGQTCWPTSCTCASGTTCGPSNCTPQFACIPAVTGPRPLDHCDNTIGTATCGDHQACIAVTPTTGVCLEYCGPNRACDPSQPCTDFPVGQGPSAPTVSVCVPHPSDAGPPDAGSPFDSGRILGDGAAETGQQQ